MINLLLIRMFKVPLYLYASDLKQREMRNIFYKL